MRIHVNDGFKFSNIFFSFLFFFPVRKYAGDECCNVMACVTDSEEDTNAKDLKKLPFNVRHSKEEFIEFNQ